MDSSPTSSAAWIRNSSLTAAALSGLTLAVWAAAPTKLLIAFLCLLVSGLIALLLKVLCQLQDQPRQPDLLQMLLDLSRDGDLAAVHTSLAGSLRSISEQKDCVFRQLALHRLQMIDQECRVLGEGKVDFASTETWRAVYEELLRSPGLHLYRSVAYIESPHYWQDGPGQQSTALNLELHDAGVVNIERTAIIADHLWPPEQLFPVEPLHSWLDQQHRHGIWLRLVRESALENDTDLLGDFGIYGSRAVGIQVADPAGRTIRFALDFRFEKVQEAEVRWTRLNVYATSYRELLERQH